ncbi:tetratricopeptide repeat protein [uncultured Dokdonia sp.]|uniref:tetratricopeptide repeat protein n=1 Tax=uncultured Dokdonia sp. TaxID=575653 RepID=UPI00260A5E3D|nr:tetratricopeptide repeat protein [uncultured Dokdonia sp.]
MDKDTLIHNYFHQTLTEEDEVLLNKLLESDPEFNALFELEKDLNAVLIDTGKDRLKQQFIDFENQEPEENKVTSSPSFLRYAVAACVIIGLSILASKYFIDTTNTDDLFAENFTAYRNIVVPIERGEGIDTSQEDAFFKYEMKDYNAAITGFQAEFKKTQASYYLFYIANAHLALGDTKQAIPLLEEHQKFKDDFYQKSRWYLALAYVKEKNKEKSIALLEEISASDGFNHKEAKKLLYAIR